MCSTCSVAKSREWIPPSYRWSAAAKSCALSTGGIFRMVPCLWVQECLGIGSSALADGMAPRGIGMPGSFFDGCRAIYSAPSQLFFRCLATAVTEGWGRLGAPP